MHGAARCRADSAAAWLKRSEPEAARWREERSRAVTSPGAAAQALIGLSLALDGDLDEELKENGLGNKRKGEGLEELEGKCWHLHPL